MNKKPNNNNNKHCPEVKDVIDEKDWKSSKLKKLVDKVVETYADEKGINNIEGLNLPNRQRVYEMLDNLFTVLFPGFYGHSPASRDNIHYEVGDLLHSIFVNGIDLIEKAYRYGCLIKKCDNCNCRERALESITDLLEAIPEIRETLKEDINSAYEGDPAAESFDEIILCYPAVEAIATNRLAHRLYSQKVPIIPRMMSERAHQRTGIDIHPGATIGKGFFIDHGTGVVIGETTNIGEYVKIYQGVTLGALSFRKDERGNLRRGYKRHPTVEDHVTIYAGATILGGKTVIGKGAVIGGNLWITSSVPAGATISFQPKDYSG